MTKQRIVILGGGFGGVYAALGFEKYMRKNADIEVLIVNQDNFFLFTPMLHEVASSELDPNSIVSPLHKLFDNVHIFCGHIQAINLEAKSVTLVHGDSTHSHDVNFDHLVVALGSETKFLNLPGVAENALSMRSLGDAITIRNRMIAMMEEANFECCASQRKRLLTFAVAGGGFAGVETVAAMHDFLNEVVIQYAQLKREDIKVVLVHSGKCLLPELHENLGQYAAQVLAERGLEVRFGVRVSAYDGTFIKLNDGSQIEAGTLVWTAGNGPNPLLETLNLPKENGRLKVNSHLLVEGRKDIWALGDCAYIPRQEGGCHPPTAQHAVRQGKLLTKNIIAQMHEKALGEFSFKTLGQLASLGRRRGIAQILGLRFSGFIAWWLWRTIYLMKLPSLEKKVRVALDWTVDLFFSKDFVQLPR